MIKKFVVLFLALSLFQFSCKKEKSDTDSVVKESTEKIKKSEAGKETKNLNNSKNKEENNSEESLETTEDESKDSNKEKEWIIKRFLDSNYKEKRKIEGLVFEISITKEFKNNTFYTKSFLRTKDKVYYEMEADTELSEEVLDMNKAGMLIHSEVKFYNKNEKWESVPEYHLDDFMEDFYPNFKKGSAEYNDRRNEFNEYASKYIGYAFSFCQLDCVLYIYYPEVDDIVEIYAP